MDTPQDNPKPTQPETIGALAEFETQGDLVAAAREVRARGYTKLDAFSPFPIHAMDEALGVQPTRLPWIALVAGVTGGLVALLIQWWTNAVDYPFLISGKPRFSLPANIPVTFEVIILSAAFAAFFGMLALNRLPKLANPLLRNERFLRATNDGFFLLVDAQDERFDPHATSEMLDGVNARHVELLADTGESSRVPRFVVLVGAVLITLALLPPVMIASARSTTSDKPRLHTFFDMDFQPKFKSQTTSTLFTDGRAMRPRVEGTIPRGQLKDSRFDLGVNPDAEIATAEASDPVVSPTSPPPTDTTAWVTEFPLPITDELMQRGRQRFNIHCAICHGRAGQGNGLASQRALELQQGTWVPPTSIHAEHVQRQPVGELFNTITNGVRKMPAYGHQISPEDRWAIVLYMRALQRSQDSSIEDVPEELKSTLREMN